MKQTAGTLLYKFVRKKMQVLLVHPSGGYNKKKPWSIPKGEPDKGEELELAARRETMEETGIVSGDLTPLGFIDYRKSKKRVFCFAGPAPDGQKPWCACWEVDRAEFIEMSEARQLIHPDQEVFLDRLEEMLED
jgi:predicted NUDIX family NTP pyrophosphohydrolase